MLTTLPDFTPRDSHSLWYTSSRGGTAQPQGLHDTHHGDSPTHNHGSGQSRSRGHIIERTALARLAADEQFMNRRRIQVQNFGSGWLRPPGVAKTLHQMREEKREQEEHQEAMRREQLAQELAEAEGGGMPDEGMMDDVQLDGAHDLDDEIPDADDHFGMGDNDEDDDGDEEGLEAEDPEELDDEALREERQNDLMAARMRMTDDAFREALVRGDPDGDDMYGGVEELEEEHQGHMLDEDDFAHDGMEANLDDDIPEAESGLYEHTDSEAELSSSDDEERDEEQEDQDIGFVPRTAQMAPPQSPTLRGRRVSGRESLDLSNILSQDESSFMDSSPVQRRRHG
ncbi:anaphase-promoting complex apc15 domain protein [Metarhizium robertsii]|uniref:Anaphase-promoting complex, subunit 15/MND2 n=2 Tax=Metarhizium robertsii TaxID=568076 RepID=E9EPC4_METRA|nr:Anaphase-promoting complex, subunit 15/MND2 [Metarhizium robertsii ARSEF 23]EFZ02236.1 Anaphase-promoting complex, subunit 15/MND2 [Metarhizium robertsii ARSEF 23]EXV05409.1 anaphase-promoting complex apc15 domain protein [Metarhizium robertsii]